ncbi:MAG: hypothetical protein JJU27_06865 [Gammaproteobacteria bacterium]|nr:hypothetical protein [Gammaproteobacteria bacterium]
MARTFAGWAAALLLMFPLHALALGLGSIDLRSGLGQPLDAEVALTSATAEDLASLRIEVAPREAFDRYGLERPAFLDSLRFDITSRRDGIPVVRITSTQPIREPFLTFLVEARWARGRLLREYTVLLDPPTFMPEPSAAAPVTAPRATPAQPDERSGRVTRPAAQPAPAEQPRMSTPVRAAPALDDDGTYVVQRNDTLWALADRLRQGRDVSVNQMMIGLFEANPGAFDGNINRLRAGSTLSVPDAATLRRVAAADANARVSEQNRAWRAAPAAAPTARLQLVAPEDAPTTPAATDPGATAARAEAEALRGETEQLRSEAARLREELAETRRLLEIRDAELSAMQRLATDAEPVEAPAEAAAPLPGVDLEREQIFIEEDPVVADEPAPVPATEPTVVEEAPAAPPPARVVTTTPEPGLLERVLGWLAAPLLWIVLGALVVIAAVVLFLKRRGQADDSTGRWEALEAEAGDDLDDAAETAATRRLRAGAVDADAGRMAATGAAAAAAGGALATGASRTEAASRPTPELEDGGMHAAEVAEGDPIAEADFHMAYGLYDQAADLIEQAVAESPERSDLRLKLAEIHFVWGNQEGFVAAARAVKEHVSDGAEWDKTLIMAKQICPDDPLFAGEAASGGLDVDFEGGDDTGMFSLDFEVDDDSGTGADDSLDMQFDGGDVDDAAAEDDFMLNIGSQTATNIERGLLEGEDSGTTSESPTIQQPAADSPTVETPTIESRRPDTADTLESQGPYGGDGAETVESPTLYSPDNAETMESPGLDHSPTTESPTLEQARPGKLGGALEELDADQTAEIDLDDLGLDLEGLDVELSDDDLDITGVGEVMVDLGDADQSPFDASRPMDTGTGGEDHDGEASTRNQALPSDAFDDEDMFSPTGITQVIDEGDLPRRSSEEDLIGDDDATRMAPSPFDSAATTRLTRLTESDLDLDLDELSGPSGEDPGAGDTVQQPRPSLEDFDSDVFGGDDAGSALDLDIGDALDSADDPTGTAEAGGIETMTEIGTKLDLARAYIDMGDPDGARSILDEVLDEGDQGQKQEARSLLETIGG